MYLKTLSVPLKGGGALRDEYRPWWKEFGEVGGGEVSLPTQKVSARHTRSWKLRPVLVWRTPWFMMLKQSTLPEAAVQ